MSTNRPFHFHLPLLSCMSSHGSSHFNHAPLPQRALLSKLGHRFNLPLRPPSAFFSLLLLPCRFFFPQKTSGADPASVPEKATDSDESKASSEEKTREERSRTESPSTKTEPSANQKESALKQTELSSGQNSPKSECVWVTGVPFFSSDVL